GDLVYSVLVEGRTTLDRNVDVGDWDSLALHHERFERTDLRQFYPIRWFTVGLFHLPLQHIEQRLRLLQIARIKPLREPPVHRSQQFARFPLLSLVAPEPSLAHRGA